MKHAVIYARVSTQRQAALRTDLEIVIAEVKRQERFDAANWGAHIAFLESLKNAELAPEVQFLLRYMVCGERLRSAGWANGNGWKFKPAKGNRRPFKDVDVDALMTVPPVGWGAELVVVVKASCFSERGRINTGK